MPAQAQRKEVAPEELKPVAGEIESKPKTPELKLVPEQVITETEKKAAADVWSLADVLNTTPAEITHITGEPATTADQAQIAGLQQEEKSAWSKFKEKMAKIKEVFTLKKKEDAVIMEAELPAGTDEEAMAEIEKSIPKTYEEEARMGREADAGRTKEDRIKVVGGRVVPAGEGYLGTEEEAANQPVAVSKEDKKAFKQERAQIARELKQAEQEQKKQGKQVVAFGYKAQRSADVICPKAVAFGLHNQIPARQPVKTVG